MVDLFEKYWWLLFPLMGFAFGGFGMWLNYKRSRDALELIKMYAQQGKEPPAGLLAAVSRGGAYDAQEDWTGVPARRGRRERRYHNGERLMTFTALAVGFGAVAWWGGEGPTRLAFGVVALVMGVMAVGSLIILLVQRRDREGQ
ncbi:hypothetical protein [Caulobacter mirabilis]|uniref:hypothetical protein n=1 Tax=Caulobacter mirabilis TaxID=69666 RepID=UPI00123712EE|nr:hypothetical protein [Caulobacter mirabilis]